MVKKLNDEELLEALQERLGEFQNAVKDKHDLREQLTEVNKKLDDAEAFKSHFIARISNEIINPFTSITTIADNILKSESLDWEEVHRMVEHIYNEAFFLDFQLRNLFTAAKIESGEIEREVVTTHPSELIQASIDSFVKQAEKKGLKINKDIQFREGETFKTDSEKLKLIMKNLVSNAVKYSEKESVVSLQARFDENGFYFTIENEGEIIPEEKREGIFDRFRQLDTRIHSLNPGSGIGLSICKELADILYGSISASEGAKGMRFSVVIPEAEQPSEGFDQSGDELFFDDENTTGEIL
ncbi:MAG: HAMP domain-containing histidine kinase [Bacteroidales bacterium]|nr:HAMP domain-containing histidine kinase [Bacteroidales bacterium]MCF8338724.1 HAMP domain-containing histidine kinase [Bacteroidales bacterium]